MQDTLTLEKIDHVAGSVNLIGSKSLTNRALLLSALGTGTTRLTNILRSDDSEVMLSALQTLGVKVTLDSNDDTVVTVEGMGGVFNNADAGVVELFLGNAGTAMRPLAAALALSDGTYRLTGEPRMYERPIGILVDALRALGAKIEYLGNEGYPPLLITGVKAVQRTAGGEGSSHVCASGAGAGSGSSVCELEVAGNTSSQFISALLMVSALLDRPVHLKVKGELISRPYVHMTIELLKRFGIEVVNNCFESFDIAPQKLINPASYLVEGDASGATYFLAAAAISGEVTVKGVGRDSIQGDTRFIEVLERMGANIEVGEDFIRVSKAPVLHGIDIDMNDMPDAAMTLVPMALFTDSPVVIRNIESWRVKETDRIAAMAAEMRKLGCKVEEGQDYIMVDGSDPQCASLRESGDVPAFDTYNDHRIAMCMSLAALDRKIVINDPGCCRKTFPDYFTRFSQVSVRK